PHTAHYNYSSLITIVVLSLIGMFIHFNHNDKSKPGKRGEKSRTRSHHDLDPALSGPAELIVPLSGRHTGIQDRDLISEPSGKSAHSLISQRDLRNQHDHLPA